MALNPRYVSILGRAALALFLMLPLVPAQAGEAASAWAEARNAAARLVAAGEREIDGERVLLAGIQVRLDKGWKTYWRNPGDAGLPPVFDWSDSANLGSARVLWPAPKRIADPAGSAIGYQGEVVFPVAVRAADADKPVELAVAFEFAVCADICVPVSADLALTLPPGGAADSPHASLLGEYLDRVPVKIAPGEEAGDAPVLAALDYALAPPEPHIAIEALFPAGAEKADLFIEGPESFYVPMTERVGEVRNGRVRFRVDLSEGGDPEKLRGETLTFTLVSAGGSSETTHVLE